MAYNENFHRANNNDIIIKIAAEKVPRAEAVWVAYNEKFYQDNNDDIINIAAAKFWGHLSPVIFGKSLKSRGRLSGL